MSFINAILFNKIISGGIELLLVDAWQIPQGFAIAGNIGNIIMSIPDNATDHLTAISDGSIPGTVVESLHDLRTNTNYQVTTTGNMKLAVEITTTGANGFFKVWKSTLADSATGTPVYDFTNTATFDTGAFTTPILEFAVTANDFINIENLGASSVNARAWIVEIP